MRTSPKRRWTQLTNPTSSHEKNAISNGKVRLPMDPPAWRETLVDFSQSQQSFASTGGNTSLARASGSYRMASTSSSWRLHIKRKSDFCSSASISATYAKQRLPRPCQSEHTRRRLKLQNLTLVTRTGRSTSSLPENLTADVHYAIGKCEALDFGRQWILHGNPSAIARDFFLACGSPSTSCFAECALPVLCVTTGHSRSRF